ncbi:MAG: hypothetical protein ACK4NF_01755, partial [Planctomycetota bacterium]
MKGAIKKVISVGLIYSSALLVFQEQVDKKATDNMTLTRQEALAKQVFIKELFTKFLSKVKVVAKRLKSQNVEYARRVEMVEKFVKDSGVYSDLESIIKMLESENVKVYDTITAIDNFMKKLDRILEILENKLRQQEMQKKLEEMRKREVELKELAKKQKELIDRAKNLSKDIKDLEEMKEALEKFINQQEAIKKITEKEIQNSKSDEELSELIKRLRELEKKQSSLYDKMIESMPRESRGLAEILDKLMKLEEKMSKTQNYLKAVKDLENNLDTANKENLEKELGELLTKAGKAQKTLDEFRKSGDIPESDRAHISSQLKKFANQVARFQDKFLQYPFETKRFNRLMETLLKAQQAFDFASQLADENLAVETASE